MRHLLTKVETFKTRDRFTISRGSRLKTDVVLVTLKEENVSGRGECVPYRRYGEDIKTVLKQITSVIQDIEAGATRIELLELMPPGAARNAIDCALFDLEAKKTGNTAWELTGITPPKQILTAFTISLDDPSSMANAASVVADYPILKLKLGGDGDLDRVKAVRAAAKKSRLIVDANESWTVQHYEDFSEKFLSLGVELIEQPFPAQADFQLSELPHPIPICADESCHDRSNLSQINGKYDFINIKLDKAGGLTESLALLREAKKLNLGVMIGCMLGTSLAMAPAMLLCVDADLVDLDGPLLLAEDRPNNLHYQQGCISIAKKELWG